jgi:NADPH:quinone reductase-like Zn-dependent oxidoreductase
MPTATINNTTMKAYLVKEYKRPMEAGDALEPTVGDHDVLVDIHAAGVNLLDAKIRDGEFKLLIPTSARSSSGTTSPARSPASAPRRRASP